jgi:hypothetical protein
MEAHIYNLIYLGGGDWRNTAQGQHRQNIISKNNLGMLVCACKPNYEEGMARRIMV